MAGVAVAAGTPTAIGVVGGGAPLLPVLAWVAGAGLLLVGVSVLADLLRWRATTYSLTADRLEITFSLLARSKKSLARDRIRSVDLTASPVHRALGVAVLSVGTGRHESGAQGRIKLDPLAREDAERLRAELLRHAAGEPADTAVLAKLDWAWLRYAPVSFAAPALGLAAFGAVVQVSEWFGVQRGLFHFVFGIFRELPLVVLILVLLAAAVVIGAVGALGLFVEMWWRFRLDREPGGTLRVRRGLLTTRSITLEQRRLRGVDVVEPLGSRLAGAARVDAVATGVRQKQDDERTDYHTLLPAAPLDVANRVAAAVLGEPVAPTAAARLKAHPAAARGRRLRWWLLGASVPVAVLVVLGLVLTDVLFVIGLALAVVALPVSAALGLDAYRSLGHALTGCYLVTRSGAVRRSTVALEREGVLGWTVKQSIFQRRRGLATFTATTAAGAGAYSIRDASADEGLDFAATATPGVLAPFVSAEAEASRA
ncbi:PH domain-containing protein [Amycolatopsis sp. NPDC051903]|uniref:PH domain-containing protein n=1 Tax=Amycolatopsis sp. NPDC051903 TaxID=3363936 RepID=UPI0037AD7488